MIDLAELKKIEREAVALLGRIANANPAEVIAALKPQETDYARVFIGDAAATAQRGYQELWSGPPRNLARPNQTVILAAAAPADSLGTENELSREFPGGYRRVAQHLQPDLVWVAFKFVEPGQTTGMAYDGLVRLGDRWAWFPKPWRVLGGTSPVDN